MIERLNVICLGGAGTFGHALARRRKLDGWTGKMTIYSTDSIKHEKMRREYPDINFVQGDIRNPDTLYNAMVGHDVVIHAAAVKVIPTSEFYSIDTFDVNVNGSQCVCSTALRAHIQHVLAISTDKAAHPANAYGASKYLMEKLVQEYSRQDFETQFHLVRFGNVLESNGSVIEAWRKAAQRGESIKMTDPEMTRFWLSPSQAVNCAIRGIEQPRAGWIYIPMLPSLSIAKLAEYTVDFIEGTDAVPPMADIIPIRPGEKKHETLLTLEEGWYTVKGKDYFLLAPITSPRFGNAIPPYSSDMAPELTKQELLDLLVDG